MTVTPGKLTVIDGHKYGKIKRMFNHAVDTLQRSILSDVNDKIVPAVIAQRVVSTDAQVQSLQASLEVLRTENAELRKENASLRAKCNKK